MPASRDNRLDKAKELYFADIPIADIAMRTGTKYQTVRRWITRYGWTAERNKLKQAQVSPELDAIAAKELETAHKLYAAAVDERAAMVDDWIAARQRSLNPDYILGYTGKYSIASHVERELFCNGIRDICDVIKLAKREIDKAQSPRQNVKAGQKALQAPFKVINGTGSISSDMSSCEA